MPELIGGHASIQQLTTYTENARRAGIEECVFVQFVVNEKGEVENPVIVRGISGEQMKKHCAPLSRQNSVSG